MIGVKDTNGNEVLLNPDNIEALQEKGEETLVLFVSGQRMLVSAPLESFKEILDGEF